MCVKWSALVPKGGKVCGATWQAEGLGSPQECHHAHVGGTGKKHVAQGKEPGRAQCPSCAMLRLLLLLLGGSWLAAGWWSSVLQGCPPSTACFLQADPKQGPEMAPSGKIPRLGCSPGDFWKERPPCWPGPNSAHLSSECHHAGVTPGGRMSPGRARTPAGPQPLDAVLQGQRASAAVHCLEKGRTWFGTGYPP